MHIPLLDRNNYKKKYLIPEPKRLSLNWEMQKSSRNSIRYLHCEARLRKDKFCMRSGVVAEEVNEFLTLLCHSQVLTPEGFGICQCKNKCEPSIMLL